MPISDQQSQRCVRRIRFRREIRFRSRRLCRLKLKDYTDFVKHNPHNDIDGMRITGNRSCNRLGGWEAVRLEGREAWTLGGLIVQRSGLSGSSSFLAFQLPGFPALQLLSFPALQLLSLPTSWLPSLTASRPSSLLAFQPDRMSVIIFCGVQIPINFG